MQHHSDDPGLRVYDQGRGLMKIRNRITLWVTVAGLLTSLVFSFVVFLEMREQPFKILDSELETMAAAVAARLARAQSPLEAGLPDIISIPEEPGWIKVYDQDLRPIYQSELSEIVALPFYRNKRDGAYTVIVHIPESSPRFRQGGSDEVSFRVRVLAKAIAGKKYWIQTARPMEKLEEEISDLVTAICIGLAVSTALLLCVSYVLAGRIVRPIAAINRLAREINETTLETRIPLGKSRDEIFELSTCLNQMFDRLHFSFIRQKQYLADASHELRSPIAILRLFFEEAAQRRDLPESFQQQLNVQGNNVLRMDRLVKTLLELSVLEVKASLVLKPFCVTDLVRSILEDFSPLMERANIRLETDLPKKLNISGDTDSIRRALINILDNAVRYNVEGGRIKVVVEQKDSAVCISFENTGPGIPKDDLKKVFDQFYRVEKSRSSHYGGAGLGLALVREIVWLHHGEVSIASEIGNWTRIDILLPQQSEFFVDQNL